MTIRYYEGAGVLREREISAEQTLRFVTYTEAHFDDDGELERTLLYDGPRLVKVNYYRSTHLDETKSFHLRNYAGVPFDIWKTLSSVGGYVWEYAYSFSPSGELTTLSKVLSDDTERQLMQIDLDADKRVEQITKYYWTDGKTLRYVFEYDETGAFLSGYDSLYGDHAFLPDIKDSLPDPAFYEYGYTLPRALDATGIPPDPH
ncbi:MAG TPA: hypothetical protein VNA19_15350 [Pyrinomonadaceae bacterium]|jgi:hypothetical protein|nr:hypothetical protein [Pyrinomonadaceae bacterium]